MKITILTEGGKEFGFGHITRCISIYQGFLKQNIKPSFIVYGDESLSDILKDIDFSIYNWQYETSKLINEVKQCDILIIDSIEMADLLLNQLIELPCFVVLIDDFLRRSNFTKGILVDWTVLADKKKYHNLQNNVKYLLGSKYTPLRKKFNIKEDFNINKSVENILITFGGSDVRNITPIVLDFLVNNYPELNKIVIVGAGFDNIEQIKSVSDNNTKLIFNADATIMSESMINADIAIASGGQTLYEIARVGLPFIAITLVDNQTYDILGWEEVGALLHAGWYNDENLLENINKYMLEIIPFDTRKKMRDNAKKFISPDGTKILVSEILKEYNRVSI